MSKNFSFEKLIPIPSYLYKMPGNLVEKALATYFTDYGLSNEPLSDFQIDVLKELGIDVPKNPREWYYEITLGINLYRLKRLYKKESCIVTISKFMVTSAKEISVISIGEHLLM